jgi:hypothetical protein
MTPERRGIVVKIVFPFPHLILDKTEPRGLPAVLQTLDVPAEGDTFNNSAKQWPGDMRSIGSQPPHFCNELILIHKKKETISRLRLF